ncbi:MAG: hypothetical protein J0L62_07460 [Bacteroidetes bacterium]|nr:hypothetical protein [Bacteroidota bacterium]
MDLFLQIVRSVKRRWKFWTLFPLAGMGITFLLTMNEPKTYVSVSTLNINFPSSKVLSLTDDVLQQFEVNLYFENLIELIRSKKTIDRLQLQLISDQLNQTLNFPLKGQPFVNEADKTGLLARVDSLLDKNKPFTEGEAGFKQVTDFLNAKKLSYSKIVSGLKVNRVGNSNYIKLLIESDEPMKSVYLAENLIRALIWQNRIVARNRTSFDREMYEKLVEQARLVLDEKVNRLEKYKVKKNIINLDEYTKALVNQIVNLELQITKLTQQKAEADRGLSKLQETGNIPAELPLNLSSNKSILEKKARLKVFNEELLRNQFETSQNSRNKDIEDSIRNLKREISESITGILSDVPYDVGATRQEIATRTIGFLLDREVADEGLKVITGELKRVTQYITVFAPIESEIGTLNSEINVAQESYLILLNKLNLAKTVEQGKGEGEIVMLDPPGVPEKPEPSKRWILILLSGMSLFVIIVSLLVAIEILDATISTVEQYEDVSSLPLLGVIPDRTDTILESEGLSNQIAEMISIQQVRQIGKGITNSGAEKKCILFVSSHREEGKTTLASELAKQLIKSGKKLLLLQADWMKTDFEPTPEFPFLGQGKTVPGELSQSGFWVLASEGKSCIDERSEEDWKSEIIILKNRYDFVFIVSPPVSVFTEWKDWTNFSDGLIWVFRANRVFQASDRRNQAMISEMGEKVIGSVLNGVTLERMESYLGTYSKKTIWFKKMDQENDFQRIYINQRKEK